MVAGRRLRGLEGRASAVSLEGLTEWLMFAGPGGAGVAAGQA